MMNSNDLVEAFVRRPVLRQLLRPVVAFIAVIVAGIVGFRTVDGIGIIDSLFWLIDPTSIELHFQTHEGPATLVKAYAIVVLSGLVVASLWIGETLFSAAFGGQIQEEFKHMKIEQDISALSDHVVICGYGTFGKTIAARLREADREVVVIEQQDAQYQQAIEDGILAVNGDARREETLADSGVKRAATVVGAIDDSNANIQIAIAASQLAPTVTLVVRAGDQRDEALARRAGADEVVIPEVVSGEHVCTSL
ncbi:potassium channel family protein [Natrialba aegyptia]|uniref:Potassium channel protein n=1 Tax=Natrialba aegyptia DSM 13077 TaxID=1227491 RepID=M0QSK6_9EURY|nr:NAD(P)-binding protein [Natrialba aegyptia]ELZ04271.1 potassium channel protein [Natrialba aegyptia DSM 13077]